MSSNGDEQSCVGRYWASIVDNAVGFKNFLYNSEDGTVMGRDGSSWLRISIFYLGYYLFLAGLFAVSIAVTLSALDEFQPYFQTRLQYPGVTILPRTDKFDPTALDIVYDPSDETTWKPYTDGIDKFISNYKGTNKTANLIDCAPNRKPFDHQKFTDDTRAAACSFTKTKFLSDCQKPPYGYNTMNPCIFVKLNQVINWNPVPFMSLNDELASSAETGAFPLKKFLNDTRETYSKSMTYVTCNPKDEEGQKDWETAKYAPSGLENQYFPYLGLKRQPDYIPPMVSVQFQGLKANTEYKMVCKVYARNMIDLARINVGYVEFKMNVAGPK